jgi:hypothetical protein
VVAVAVDVGVGGASDGAGGGAHHGELGRAAGLAVWGCFGVVVGLVLGHG